MPKFNTRIACIAFAAACACVVGPAGAAAADDAKVRVVVAFKPGKIANAYSAIAAVGGRVRFELREVNAIAIEVPRKALIALKRHAAVDFVEEDAERHVMAADAPSGPPYATGQTTPYGIPMVQADKVSDSAAANRTVCIVDSGIDAVHEDLSANNLSGANFSGSGDWNTDENEHGTHVAGTIAAINQTGVGVVGVMPNKKINLYISKVFDASGQASSAVIARAMLACGKAGANVVSMSLGGASSNKLEQAVVKYLAKKDILLIAAAGNAGDTSTSYPAGFAEVMSVAAIDSNKTVASFSQHNADVEIAAPGVGTLSTVPMGTGRNATTKVGSTSYSVLPMAGTPALTKSGPLADFGIGDTPVAGSMTGKVCLIQRGTIDFATKVTNCQNSGGVGAIIYNNVAGPLNGTLGTTVTTIPSVGASDTDGATMKTQLGQTTQVAVTVSNYAHLDGTSMATPHVSAVAALVWSQFPTCTAAQIRSSLNLSALDLGTAGRDEFYGYGLVQAKAAVDRITSKGCGL